MFNLNSSNFKNTLILLYLLHCLILFTTAAVAPKLRSPASEFNKHRVVQPVVHHAKTKREITTTRDTNGAHHPEVTIKVPIDDREYVLDLQLNKDLITDDHEVRYQAGGKAVSYKPTKEDMDLCQYSGMVRGVSGSWVAVSTCQGVRGVIFDGEQMRYIEPAEGDEIQSQHYVYDHSELSSDYSAAVGGVANYTDLWTLRNRRDRSKRATANGYLTVREPRYVELVLVADHSEYVKNDRDLSTVLRKMRDFTNIVNSVYAPLNIFVVLVGVEVWTKYDEIEISANSSTTLVNFLRYRSVELLLHNDNAHFITQKKFDERVLGSALLGSMCRPVLSGGIARDHSPVTGLVAMTIAHEIGHAFGMSHDEGICKCLGEECIMHPSSSSDIPDTWSRCSLDALDMFFEKGLDYCLLNKPKKVFTTVSQ